MTTPIITLRIQVSVKKTVMKKTQIWIHYGAFAVLWLILWILATTATNRILLNQ